MMTDSSQPKKTPRPFSSAFYRILRSYGLTEKYNGWRVISNWEEIVGKEVAKRAKAVNFEDNCLYLSIADDSWRQELSMDSDNLLKQIQSYPYGSVVKELRLIGRQKGFK